jgi:hypothetical protein
MGNLICAAILLVIAFVSYTRWQKEKASGEKNRERIWMIVSILAGAGAVIQILAVLIS